MSRSKGRNPHRRDIPQRIWDEVLKGLTDLEAEVVRLRFGLGGRSPMTVDKVSKTLGVSRERIRKIEAKVLNRVEKAFPQNKP